MDISALLIMLVLTILVYGAFPFIFAKVRRESITKKKYRWICYGVNFVIMLCFAVANGGAASGAPYLLWTAVFSSVGIKILGRRGVMEDSEYLPDDPNRLTECKSCGYRDKKFFNACPRCGKYAKQYVYINEGAAAETAICHNCGEKLTEGDKFCTKCGASVSKQVGE